VTVPYAACAQLYPPEDEHLRLETCRGEYYFMNKTSTKTFLLQSVLTQAVYRQATKNSHREWQYHMLHVHTVCSWRWALEARNM